MAHSSAQLADCAQDAGLADAGRAQRRHFGVTVQAADREQDGQEQRGGNQYFHRDQRAQEDELCDDVRGDLAGGRFGELHRPR
jgi:hypothetical protein